MAIVEEMMTVEARNPLPAFVARPDDPNPHPAVIVVHEIFGVTENIKRIARRLADSGIVAIAPDFFRHEPVSYEQFQEARQVASCLSDKGAMEDIGAVLDHLDSSPGAPKEKVGIVGFCMGGRIAFLAACKHADRIKGCVDYYGARKSGGSVHPGQTMVPLDEAPLLQCPVLLFYGGKDPYIPTEEIETVRERLDHLGKQAIIHVYPDADHGFLCEDRASYDSEAAADAWLRTLQFLAELIGEGSVG